MSDKIPFPPCNCVACRMRRAAELPPCDKCGAGAGEPCAADCVNPAPLELEDDGGGYDPYNTAARRLGAAIVARAVRS